MNSLLDQIARQNDVTKKESRRSKTTKEEQRHVSPGMTQRTQSLPTTAQMLHHSATPLADALAQLADGVRNGTTHNKMYAPQQSNQNQNARGMEFAAGDGTTCATNQNINVSNSHGGTRVGISGAGIGGAGIGGAGNGGAGIHILPAVVYNGIPYLLKDGTAFAIGTSGLSTTSMQMTPFGGRAGIPMTSTIFAQPDQNTGNNAFYPFCIPRTVQFTPPGSFQQMYQLVPKNMTAVPEKNMTKSPGRTSHRNSTIRNDENQMNNVAGKVPCINLADTDQSSVVGARRSLSTFDDKTAHKCTICSKEFSRRGNLVRHIKLHSGHKPYQCDECGKHFASKGNLKSHTSVHSKPSKFYCEYCGRSFIREGFLKKHVQKLHVEKGDQRIEEYVQLAQKSFADFKASRLQKVQMLEERDVHVIDTDSDNTIDADEREHHCKKPKTPENIDIGIGKYRPMVLVRTPVESEDAPISECGSISSSSSRKTVEESIECPGNIVREEWPKYNYRRYEQKFL